MSLWTIKKSSLRPSFHVKRIKAENLFLIEKQTVVRWLFSIGMLLAFFITLAPWFLLRVYSYYAILAFLPIAASLYLSKKIRNGIFGRKDYKIPTIACFVLLVVMAITYRKNAVGIISTVFQVVIYMSLFKANREELHRVADLLTKVMATILAFSIPFFLLHLFGFPISHTSLVPEGMDYTFENYRFFLIDDRFSLAIIPRFQSVFLEPSHLGMSCVALLYSQIGKWNTWRCRILFFAIFISFSLAAYLCLVAMLFSAAWMKGKAILGKILLLLGLCTAVVVGSLFYNKGDNLVNILIVQRLTTNEQGEMEGDNRTTGLFTDVFEKYAETPEVFIGRGWDAMQKFGFGNSGFRVFIYVYGIVSVLFLIAFFLTFLRTSDNTRAKVSMLIIQGMSFIAHGIPVKFYFFIPLYILIFSDVYPKKKQKKLKEVKA